MTNKIIDFESAKQTVRILPKKLPEIDVLRTFAMLAVVAIHMLNLPVSDLEVGTKGQGFFFLLRGMLIFAVPCFLFVGTLMVSHSAGPRPIEYKSFYRKKWIRVAVPYLLWSAFYMLLLLIIGGYDIESLKNPATIFYLLAYGNSYEHLYFMPILLEFFLLVPILLPLARKIKYSPLKAFILAMSVQIAVYFVNRLFLYEHFKMLSSTFLWYFSIGFLGLWFGLNYDDNLAFVKKHRNKLFVALVVVGVVHYYYQTFLWQQLWNDISFNTFFYTLNLHLYMLFCTLGLLIVSHWFVRYPISRSARPKRIHAFIHFLAPESYGIYLMHPLFTFLLRKLISTRSPLLWGVIVALGVILVSLLCGRITKALQHRRIFSYIFGNGGRIIRTKN